MEKEIIKVIYKYNKNLNQSPATGAFGGLSPDGKHVVCNFYSEGPCPPDEIEFEVEDDIIKNIKEHKKHKFVREINSTVVMSLEVADSIANWLLKLIQKGKGDEKKK